MKVKHLRGFLNDFNPEAQIKIIMDGNMFTPRDKLVWGDADDVSPMDCDYVYLEIPILEGDDREWKN